MSMDGDRDDATAGCFAVAWALMALAEVLAFLAGLASGWFLWGGSR